MSLTFEAVLPVGRVTTLEGVPVRITVRNDGDEPLELPAPDDRSGALAFLLYDSNGNLVRRMSGLTHQAMMTLARVDAAPSLAPMGPGESWSWVVDLAKYHYALPAGEYELEAVLEHPTAGQRLQSRRLPLTVAPAPLRAVSIARDNPVIDELRLVLTADGTGTPAYYVRQHNYNRPLAAWYSRRILEDERPVAPPVCSSPNFFRTDTFDHAFYTWVVWSDGERLHARPHALGEPEAQPRVASLPPNQTFLGSAFHTARDELFVFLQDGEGSLECRRFDAAELVPVFVHPSGVASAPLHVIRADERFVHVVTAEHGILYQRLRLDGRPVENRQLFSTRLQALSLSFDSQRGLVRAIFSDGPHGRLLTMVAVEVATGAVARRTVSVPLRGDLTEAAFDRDATGRFHLVAATGRGRLYYCDGAGSTPLLVARGEGPFHPEILVPRGIYVGCYRRDLGYRFVHLRNSRGLPRVVDYETLP